MSHDLEQIRRFLGGSSNPFASRFGFGGLSKFTVNICDVFRLQRAKKREQLHTPKTSTTNFFVPRMIYEYAYFEIVTKFGMIPHPLEVLHVKLKRDSPYFSCCSLGEGDRP